MQDGDAMVMGVEFVQLGAEKGLTVSTQMEWKWSGNICLGSVAN